jgi:hypothetical protein
LVCGIQWNVGYDIKMMLNDQGGTQKHLESIKISAQNQSFSLCGLWQPKFMGQWIKKPMGIFAHIFFVFRPIFLKFSA